MKEIFPIVLHQDLPVAIWQLLNHFFNQKLQFIYLKYHGSGTLNERNTTLWSMWEYIVLDHIPYPCAYCVLLKVYVGHKCTLVLLHIVHLLNPLYYH